MPVVLPGDGDEPYPAGEYEVLASESTVELIGLTDVRDVQQVTARAIPSDIVYHVRFAGSEFTASDVPYFLGRFAGFYNALAAVPGVVGVSTFEDITAAGQLREMMQITVSSTSGRMSANIEEPDRLRTLAFTADLVAQLRAKLDQIEASGR
jgi:hypothetical protein